MKELAPGMLLSAAVDPQGHLILPSEARQDDATEQFLSEMAGAERAGDSHVRILRNHR